MIIPTRLKEIEIISLMKYRDSFLEKLQSEGIAHITKADDFPIKVYKEIRHREITPLLMKVEYYIDELMTAKFQRKRVKIPSNIFEFAKKTIEEIEIKKKDLEESENKIKKKERIFKGISDFVNSIIEVGVEFKKPYTFLYRIPIDVVEEFKSMLKNSEIFYIRKELFDGSNCFILITELSEKGKGETIKKNYSFYFLLESEFKKLKNELKKISKEIKEEYNDLQKKKIEFPRKMLPILYAIKEELLIRKENEEAKRLLSYSNYTFCLKFWVRKNDEKKVIKIAEEVCNGVYLIDVREPDPEKAPTLLKNPRVLKPFEDILKEMALPKYNEIDPTIFLAIFLPIFFGTMLSDFGYGILMMIFSAFLFKFSKSKSAKSFSQVLGVCGALTMFFGYIYGSYFGFEITSPIFNPLKRPIDILIASLVIGVIYVNVGICVGIIQNLLCKKYKKMIYQQFPWILLQIGAFLILINYLPFNINIPNSILLGLILLLGCVAILIKGGIVKLLDIPRFFSTIVSFSRIAALTLATVWIAFTINLICRLFLKNQFGIFIAPFIFVIGHTFNFAFNALGAFIHSLRLHYVEFFGMFFAGQGYPFQPFYTKRIFSEVGGEKSGG